MYGNEPRKLRRDELEVVERMLQVIADDATQFHAQIDRSLVVAIDDEGSLKFCPQNADLVDVADGPVANATQSDIDTIEGFGPHINYILFTKGGLLSELEVYKDDGSRIGWPFDASKLVLVYPGKKKPRVPK